MMTKILLVVFLVLVAMTIVHRVKAIISFFRDMLGKED